MNKTQARLNPKSFLFLISSSEFVPGVRDLILARTDTVKGGD